MYDSVAYPCEKKINDWLTNWLCQSLKLAKTVEFWPSYIKSTTFNSCSESRFIWDIQSVDWQPIYSRFSIDCQSIFNWLAQFVSRFTVNCQPIIFQSNRIWIGWKSSVCSVDFPSQWCMYTYSWERQRKYRISCEIMVNNVGVRCDIYLFIYSCV